MHKLLIIIHMIGSNNGMDSIISSCKSEIKPRSAGGNILHGIL